MTDAATKTYVIVDDPMFKVKGIKCLVCCKTSWHPKDVQNLYCGFCHAFHERVPEVRRDDDPYR